MPLSSIASLPYASRLPLIRIPTPTSPRPHKSLLLLKLLLGNAAQASSAKYTHSTVCCALVDEPSDDEFECNPTETSTHGRGNAFHILSLMQKRGITAECSTYAALLDRCLNSGLAIDARRVHGTILKLGLDKESNLSDRLISAYLSFGDFAGAAKVFDEMPYRSAASWSRMIAGFLRRKEHGRVLDLFFGMVRECVDPGPEVFASALRACGGNSVPWHLVQQIHAKVVRNGFAADSIVGNPLIDLYSKNGDVDSARLLFEELLSKDNISLVAMLSGLSQNGLGEEAVKLYSQMHRSGDMPTPYLLSSVLSTCAKLEFFRLGKQIHSQVLKWGFFSETFVGNALITLYSRCESLRVAEKIFGEMLCHDRVTYNSMISGHTQNGTGERAMQIFDQMQLSGLKPDSMTIASLLSACASIGAVQKGRQLHSYVFKAGLCSDYIIEGSVLDLYVKCGEIDEAREFFDMSDRENVVLWNVMLVAYGQMGNLRESFNLFYEMQLAGMEPNQYTYPSILRTCTYTGALDLGEQIHSLAIKTGFEMNVYVCSVLIDMYSKCGRLDFAREILDRLTEEDVVSWTAMIAGYAQHELCAEALQTFEEMQNRGIRSDNIGLSSALSACAGMKAIEQGLQIHAQACISGYTKDVSIGNALINLYARCGRIGEAYSAFENLELKDEISWNGLISGFAQSGHFEEALKMFVQMDQASVKANIFSYISAVSASANVADVKQGKQIHARMIKTGYDSEIEAGNALISLYAKCGSLEDAKREFSEMTERNEVSWNAMMTCYSQHGHGRQALKIFEQMKQEGLKPNHVTFIAVLAACSHVGLVTEGLDYFYSMTKYHGVVPRPEHYVCVVDILGRAGQLDRAKAFIEDMPIDPDAMVWRTLLSACTVYKNIEIGELAARHLLQLEPQDSASYVLLSNIYAMARKWDCRDRVRQMMKDRGVKKEPGQSWIEVKNEVHAFFVGDRLHPLAGAIHEYLDDLNNRAVALGYKQDKYYLLHENEREQKDPTAYIHSEKIAVSFGLVSLSPEIPIRIIKNLRVCNDCHTWMKFVSEIAGRTIVIRDAYRFHHFEGGHCSCGDYW